jgi:Tfp pilus assembly protein PilN
MKNINLLPKVPRAKRIFLPVLVSSILFFLLLSSVFLYAGQYFKSNLQNVENQIALTNASIQSLTNQRQLDEQTINYQNLQTEIDKLKKKRTDWIPVFEMISSKLPATGRILSAEIPKEDKKEDKKGTPAAAPQAAQVIVNLKLEFTSLSSVADYISLLQRSSLFDSVSIQSAVKTEKTFVKTAASSPSPAPTNTQSTTANTAENIKKSFENTITEGGNEGDKLLNELKWTINQQIAKQEYGVTLPDKKFNDGTKTQDAHDETSALTDADFEAARKTLDEMKKKAAAPKETVKLSTANPAASAQKFILYEVTLEITLKNPVESK